MITAYIGLGSNLEQPSQQLQRAFAALAQIPQTRLLRHSRLYRSPPMGPQDQPDYVNAVAELGTELAPLALLDALQAIENAQGRVRGRRWGERTLDLDLLLYRDQRIDEPRLQVPHPGMHERAFVLIPLAELVPDTFVIPGCGQISRLVAQLGAQPLQLLD
jgi:2-amino-4-hydroxy-6-hydroxymethyldihydropteridine diphosphokinase